MNIRYPLREGGVRHSTPLFESMARTTFSLPLTTLNMYCCMATALWIFSLYYFRVIRVLEESNDWNGNGTGRK